MVQLDDFYFLLSLIEHIQNGGGIVPHAGNPSLREISPFLLVQQYISLRSQQISQLVKISFSLLIECSMCDNRSAIAWIQNEKVAVVCLFACGHEQQEVIIELCELDDTLHRHPAYQLGLFYVIDLYLLLEAALEGKAVLVEGNHHTRQIRQTTGKLVSRGTANAIEDLGYCLGLACGLGDEDATGGGTGGKEGIRWEVGECGQCLSIDVQVNLRLYCHFLERDGLEGSVCSHYDQSALHLAEIFHMMQYGDFPAGALGDAVEVLEVVDLKQPCGGELVEPGVGLRECGLFGRVVEGDFDVLGLAAETLHAQLSLCLEGEESLGGGETRISAEGYLDCAFGHQTIYH